MSKSFNADTFGKQSRCPISRLQRALDVRDGTSGHAVPTGVHVPGHPTATQLHELR